MNFIEEEGVILDVHDKANTFIDNVLRNISASSLITQGREEEFFSYVYMKMIMSSDSTFWKPPNMFVELPSVKIKSSTTRSMRKTIELVNSVTKWSLPSRTFLNVLFKPYFYNTLHAHKSIDIMSDIYGNDKMSKDFISSLHISMANAQRSSMFSHLLPSTVYKNVKGTKVKLLQNGRNRFDRMFQWKIDQMKLNTEDGEQRTITILMAIVTSWDISYASPTVLVYWTIHEGIHDKDQEVPQINEFVYESASNEISDIISSEDGGFTDSEIYVDIHDCYHMSTIELITTMFSAESLSSNYGPLYVDTIYDDIIKRLFREQNQTLRDREEFAVVAQLIESKPLVNLSAYSLMAESSTFNPIRGDIASVSLTPNFTHNWDQIDRIVEVFGARKRK